MMGRLFRSASTKQPYFLLRLLSVYGCYMQIDFAPDAGLQRDLGRIRGEFVMEALPCLGKLQTMVSPPTPRSRLFRCACPDALGAKAERIALDVYSKKEIGYTLPSQAGTNTRYTVLTGQTD